jgi:hypothetical protein
LVRTYLPELPVGKRKGILPRELRKPGSQKPLVVSSVMNASRVESAQSRCHVQPLERPVSVDDAIGMSAKAPCSVPGYGGGSGFPARPAAIGANAATVGDQQERVEHGVSFGITGEQALRNVPIGMPEPGFDLAGAPHECLQSPVGVNRRVNHCEGSTQQLAGLDQWPTPNPLDPVVDVGTRKEIAHGVGVAQGSPAEE